jgi:hypothetical protein
MNADGPVVAGKLELEDPKMKARRTAVSHPARFCRQDAGAGCAVTEG